MTRLRWVGIVVALILVCLGTPASAANVLERLMMPGELSSAHAKLEENCSNCHETMNEKAQSGLCLDCHRPIKQDFAASRGYHGKDPVVRKSECVSCHVEHKGRDRNIVPLQPILFRHDLTEFPLAGKHAHVDCAGCHKAPAKFRDAKHACFDCHKESDVHRTQLGTDCAGCHSPEGWTVKIAAFDHSRTKFPLKGKHAEQPCVSCHVGEVYKNLPSGCNDCHAIQDVHAGRFGSGCSDCHSVESWKTAKFDHGKQTRFPLAGAHAKAQCSDCHGGDIKAKISMACIDCHGPQDVHLGKLGKDCGECHDSVAWAENVRFDHGLTDYPLVGLHQVAPCEGCHETKQYKGVKTACVGCHGGDDSHAGRFAINCESCHSPVGWSKVAFNHGRDTHFPLTGAHARLGCYDCHVKKDVADASLPTSCISCHRKNDVHRGKFGTDCARCHSTTTFRTAIIRQ